MSAGRLLLLLLLMVLKVGGVIWVRDGGCMNQQRHMQV